MIHLVVTLKGHTIGRFDVAGDQVRIGRHPDNEVQIDNMSVSRFHCTLTRDARGVWSMVDEGSHNGTFVNGARAPRRDLRDGDSLGIGQFVVSVRSDDAPRLDAVVASRQISVRALSTTRELRQAQAPEKAHLEPVSRAGPPLVVARDLIQLGAGNEMDLRVPGPPKSALIVRGYGGFQLVHACPGQAVVLVDGEPVLDRVWLEDGALLHVGGLELRFRLGMPAEEDQSTMVIDLKGFPPPLV